MLIGYCRKLRKCSMYKDHIFTWRCICNNLKCFSLQKPVKATRWKLFHSLFGNFIHALHCRCPNFEHLEILWAACYQGWQPCFFVKATISRISYCYILLNNFGKQQLLLFYRWHCGKMGGWRVKLVYVETGHFLVWVEIGRSGWFDLQIFLCLVYVFFQYKLMHLI